MPEENKTEIRLEVDKTIQPIKFEPLKISVDIKESFYWKNEADRKKKMEAHTDRMAEDFVKTFNRVAERIGEKNRCIGHITPANENAEISSPVLSNEEQFDFD